MTIAYSEQTTETISKDNSREGVLVSVAIAVINTMTISKMEKKAYFSLVIAQHIIQGSQDRNPSRVGTWRQKCRSHGEHCLLACFLELPQPAFLQHQRPQPRGSTAHCALSPCAAPIHHPSGKCPQANLEGPGRHFLG